MKKSAVRCARDETEYLRHERVALKVRVRCDGVHCMSGVGWWFGCAVIVFVHIVCVEGCVGAVSCGCVVG